MNKEFLKVMEATLKERIQFDINLESVFIPIMHDIIIL